MNQFIILPYPCKCKIFFAFCRKKDVPFCSTSFVFRIFSVKGEAEVQRRELRFPKMQTHHKGSAHARSAHPGGFQAQSAKESGDFCRIPQKFRHRTAGDCRHKAFSCEKRREPAQIGKVFPFLPDSVGRQELSAQTAVFFPCQRAQKNSQPES